MARIVLVDDNALVRETIRITLERAGHNVIEAVSGLRIEGTVADHKPDLVLTDMLMPDRDGVETVLALRRRYPGLRIIAMSGGGNRGTLDLGVAAKLGVSATITKPFDPDELNQLINKVLAGPGPSKPA